MAHKKKFNFTMPNVPAGTASTSSTVKNVSNTGQMSTSTQTTGTQGAAVNNTNTYVIQGAAGSPGVSTNTTYTAPSTNVGYTPGQWNWMDDAIGKTIKSYFK